MTSVPSVRTIGIGSVDANLFAKRIHNFVLADRDRKEWSINVED
jgi:hypothetical protein